MSHEVQFVIFDLCLTIKFFLHLQFLNQQIFMNFQLLHFLHINKLAKMDKSVETNGYQHKKGRDIDRK